VLVSALVVFMVVVLFARLLGWWVHDFIDGRKMRAKTSTSCLDVEARRKLVRAMVDEAVLFGPVSAWVAEGEARAVREWETRKWSDPNAELPADISNIRMTTIRP
jgi:hypothetical protein